MMSFNPEKITIIVSVIFVCILLQLIVIQSSTLIPNILIIFVFTKSLFFILILNQWNMDGINNYNVFTMKLQMYIQNWIEFNVTIMDDYALFYILSSIIIATFYQFCGIGIVGQIFIICDLIIYLITWFSMTTFVNSWDKVRLLYVYSL